MKFTSLYDRIRLSGGIINFPHSILEITGVDAEKFLQGQTTQNIRNLTNSQQILPAAITSSKGVLEYYFAVGRHSDKFYIFCDSSIESAVVCRLEKYIVMDDVEINVMSEKSYFLIGVELVERLKEEQSDFNKLLFGEYLGDHIAITWDENIVEQLESQGLPTFSKQKIVSYASLSGFPIQSFTANQLVTNTLLMRNAVSTNKGCYVGNETIAKIWNNRGAHKYPVWLRLNQSLDRNTDHLEMAENQFEIIDQSIVDDATYILASLPREYRVETLQLAIVINGASHAAVVQNEPPFNNEAKFKSIELYNRALRYFAQNDDTELPEYLLKLSILTDPRHVDAYESLGVLFARNERFLEAISMMQAWLEIDSETPMAHTNLSLYFMKIGEINKAEEEKALAVTKQFSQQAKLNENKNIELKQQQEKQQQMLQRKEMFEKVLEIDQQDDIALNGLAEIYKELGQLKMSSELYVKVLNVNPNMSVAYLNFAEVCLSLGDKLRAKSLLSAGLQVATHRGEMMPANKMQSMLNQLN